MKLDYRLISKLYSLGHSDKEIAEEVGCSTIAIYIWRRNNGLKPAKTNVRGPKSSIDNVLKEYNPSETEKPWKDPESLFCDVEFLEKIVGKPIRKAFHD